MAERLFSNLIVPDSDAVDTRLPIPIRGTLARLLQMAGQLLARAGRKRSHRLRLAESLALGDRRFVAVIEFEESRFLIGGTAGSLSLLARLEHEQAETRRATTASGKESS